MDTPILIVFFFFFIMNLVSFSIMLFDKTRAESRRSERISEGFMFFLATMFGSVGVYAGMFAFRHKTRKWYFLMGIPMLIVQNCAFLYVVYKVVSGNMG